MAQQQDAAAAPDMPPAMAEIKKQSADEVLAEMNRMPLFMTTLDETDGEGGENTLLEAMKALAYEGTRYEIAENFRQQGNECARAKQWNDAKEFYDKAIAALKGPQSKPDPEADTEGGKVIEVELDEEEEAKKEKVVEEASYVNRALCNLEKSKLTTFTLSFRYPLCSGTEEAPKEAGAQLPAVLHVEERGGKGRMQILCTVRIDRPDTMNNMHLSNSSLAGLAACCLFHCSKTPRNYTDVASRKLSLLHKRLRFNSPPQSLKHQSLLSIRQRLSCTRQTPRSQRRMRVRAQAGSLKRTS